MVTALQRTATEPHEDPGHTSGAGAPLQQQSPSDPAGEAGHGSRVVGIGKAIANEGTTRVHLITEMSDFEVAAGPSAPPSWTDRHPCACRGTL
eukprot:10406452-Alexandrium_andersonii.AAC.1